MLNDQWKLDFHGFLKHSISKVQNKVHGIQTGRFLLLYLLNAEKSKTPFLLGHHILTVLLFTLLCNKFAI